MPRISRADWRKHLIIVLIALVIALVILFIQSEPASAQLATVTGDSTGTDTTTQITGDDYQRAVTTERLLILGMLALVVLTWLYLRWRPAPGSKHDPDRERPAERE